MSEVIVKLTSDHIKVKGAEYVRDLVRCQDCKNADFSGCPNGRLYCMEHGTYFNDDDFCSYGEVRDE